MMKAVLINEIGNEADLLLRLLKDQYPEVDVLSVTDSIERGVEDINDLSPELVFLNVTMSQRFGSGIFKHLHHFKFDLVFVKVLNDRTNAVNIFRPQLALMNLKTTDNHGFDYIHQLEQTDFDLIFSTTIDREMLRFFESMNKHNVQNSSWAYAYKHGKNDTDPQEGLSRLFRDIIPVSTGSEVECLRIDEVVYARAFKSYAEIHLLDGSSRLISRNLSYLERKISNPFFIRPHRSYLVNARSIRKWNKADGGFLVLTDNTHIPISREGRKLLERLF